MSIKIHHGAPGSYKTSGAIADDFISAVAEGRHVITNIRGLHDMDHVIDVLLKKGKKVGDDFLLEHIDTESSDGMDKLRKFFHWADDGVFFFLDEIQEIYPKSFTDKKIAEFDYPHGRDQAKEEKRLETLSLAFEKHRHHNWDFVVTSPNIQKVHKVVREAAESAYKHRNSATIGIKGRYVEAYHAADTNGRASDFYTVVNKKIPKYVFNLYASTATGKVQDTTSGQSLFKNPRILFLLLVLFASLSFAWFGSDGEFLGSSRSDDVKTSSDNDVKSIPATTQAIRKDAATSSDIRASAISDRPIIPSSNLGHNPFLGFSFSIVSISGESVSIKAVQISTGGYYIIEPNLAKKLDYKMTKYSNCLIEIRHKAYKARAYCSAPDDLGSDTDHQPTENKI